MDKIKNLDKLLESYKAEMTKALSGFLAIPSTQGKPEANAPFGTAVAKALNYYAGLAEKLGFKCQNNGYYVTADFAGEKLEEKVGVVTHCDVVPAGKGWHQPPFGGLVADGYIYGRGAQDDKGPTIAALYAMFALKQLGLPLKRSLRQLVGGNEESGCKCIQKYVAEAEPLWGGFSPDGDFPLIFAEKGIARFRCVLAYDKKEFKNFIIHSLAGGTVCNAVPGEAEALLTLTPEIWQQLKKQQNQLKDEAKLELLEEEHQIRVRAIGKACHASTPEKGVNAIGFLLKALAPWAEGKLGNWLRAVYELFGADSYGVGSNAACADDISGRLTLNLGTIKVGDGKAQIELDMRYPVKADFNKIWQNLAAMATDKRVLIQMVENKAPLYVPKASEVVEKLMKVYHGLVDPKAEPIAIGGGTYCRYLNNFVAFGPIKPQGEDRMHQADERMKITELLELTKIYAYALYELSN